MSLPAKCLCVSFFTIFSVSPTFATVTPKDCKPPRHVYCNVVTHECTCEDQVRAKIVAGTLTLSPAPGSVLTAHDILSQIGSPANAKINYGFLGPNSVEVQGVSKLQLLHIQNKLGLDKKDLQ
jgi:hypothetical protein